MSPQLFRSFERVFAVGVSARKLVHWMLVVVIALNMVSSPFHAHHHEGGPDGYGTTADHFELDEAGSGSGLELASNEPLTHRTVADNAHVGHSVSALRGAEVKVAKMETGVGAGLPVSILAFTMLLDPPAAEGLTGWLPARERVPIPSFRTVPPDGRAPPTLHV